MALILLSALLAAAGISACNRGGNPQVRRLAIVPLENLSGEASLDAVSRAIPALLRMRLRGVPDIDPMASPSPEGRPTHILRGYFYRHGKQLRMRAYLTLPGSGRTLRVLGAYGPVEGAAAAMAAALASQLTSSPRPWTTRNPAALDSYARAAAATTFEERQAALEEALRADASFGDACVDLSDLLRLRRDAEAAEETARSCAAAGLDELSRARLELSAALGAGRMSNAAALRLRLARLLPADSELAAFVAEDFLRQQRYRDAVAWYGRAAAADPRWPNLWNLIAYAHSYAGDFDAALKAVERYAELERFSINPLDSRAEILFAAGRFQDAEEIFLEIYRRDPSFGRGAPLRKAAQARLLMGDPAAGAGHFRRYLDAAGFPEPLRRLSLLQWQYMTGEKRQALDGAGALAASSAADPDLASRAWAQMAVWQLDLGRDFDAAESCRKASTSAAGEASRRLASLCVFLAGGIGAGDWAARAERSFEGATEQSLKRFAAGYGLTLSGQFGEAALVWKELLAQTHPSVAGELRLLLAWSLVASGKTADAAPLLGGYETPRGGLEPAFECFVFPRQVYLHAAMLDSRGERKRAREMYRLYLRYAGDLESRHGETQAARRALAGS